MPNYTYRCMVCSKVFDYSSSVADRNNPQTCECGCSAVRDVEEELKVGIRPNWITENNRWSISMGVPAKQVNEFRTRFPNSVYSDDGRLLVKNRKDKMRQAKERGFVELDKE